MTTDVLAAIGEKLISGSGRADAEQSGAGTNFSGALFDGDIEIVAHAHGERGKWAHEIPRQLVAKRGEFAEEWAGTLRIVEKRRNRHQPLQLKMPEGGEIFREGGQIRFRNSAFCGFVAEMHLDEDAELLIFRGSRGIEPLREGEAIDRVDAVEEAGGARGFVALQVTDQMPGGVEICDRRNFAFKFLNAILTEMAEASVEGRDYRVRRMRLCYGDNRDFLGATPGTMRGAGDALANPREIFGDR